MAWIGDQPYTSNMNSAARGESTGWWDVVSVSTDPLGCLGLLTGCSVGFIDWEGDRCGVVHRR